MSDFDLARAKVIIESQEQKAVDGLKRVHDELKKIPEHAEQAEHGLNLMFGRMGATVHGFEHDITHAFGHLGRMFMSGGIAGVGITLGLEAVKGLLEHTFEHVEEKTGGAAEGAEKFAESMQRAAEATKRSEEAVGSIKERLEAAELAHVAFMQTANAALSGESAKNPMGRLVGGIVGTLSDQTPFAAESKAKEDRARLFDEAAEASKKAGDEERKKLEDERRKRVLSLTPLSPTEIQEGKTESADQLSEKALMDAESQQRWSAWAKARQEQLFRSLSETGRKTLPSWKEFATAAGIDKPRDMEDVLDDRKMSKGDYEKYNQTFKAYANLEHTVSETAREAARKQAEAEAEQAKSHYARLDEITSSSGRLKESQEQFAKGLEGDLRMARDHTEEIKRGDEDAKRRRHEREEADRKVASGQEKMAALNERHQELADRIAQREYDRGFKFHGPDKLWDQIQGGMAKADPLQREMLKIEQEQKKGIDEINKNLMKMQGDNVARFAGGAVA